MGWVTEAEKLFSFVRIARVHPTKLISARIAVNGLQWMNSQEVFAMNVWKS